MPATSAETQPTQKLVRRFSRRRLLEIVLIAGGSATTIRAGWDGITASSEVITKRDASMPFFLSSSRSNQLANASEAVLVAKTPTAEHSRLSTLAKTLADESGSYNERRDQLNADLWAQSNNAPVINLPLIGDISRGTSRHWGFWGGLGALAVGGLSATRLPDRLIRKITNAISKTK